MNQLRIFMKQRAASFLSLERLCRNVISKEVSD